MRSPFRQKFGIPRQAGLIASVGARIQVIAPYDRAEAFRGLEAFSHIWLQFIFHQARRDDWKPQVRPPRLGGNRRVGVFASRSPFRPNPLGLSLVALNGMQHDATGLWLDIAGADLLDGTPVLDIKPYLPWADGVDDAKAAWADEPPARLAVRFSAKVESILAGVNGERLRRQLIDVLALDPRPAYHTSASRRYGMRFGEYEIKWRVDENGVWVTGVDSTTGSD